MEDIKDLVLRYIQHLHRKKGYKVKEIARLAFGDSESDYKRIRNIRSRNTSGNKRDLERLLAAFPELTEIDKVSPSPEDIQAMQEEINQRLSNIERLVIEMTAEQKVRFEQVLKERQLEERIAELEKRLLQNS